MLRDSEEYRLQDSTGVATTDTVPARIRDILTQNLSPEDQPLTSPAQRTSLREEEHPLTTAQRSYVLRAEEEVSMSMQEENRMLQSELNRVEDLLAATRAERDEIGIKYNALTERVSWS